MMYPRVLKMRYPSINIITGTHSISKREFLHSLLHEAGRTLQFKRMVTFSDATLPTMEKEITTLWQEQKMTNSPLCLVFNSENKVAFRTFFFRYLLHQAQYSNISIFLSIHHLTQLAPSARDAAANIFVVGPVKSLSDRKILYQNQSVYTSIAQFKLMLSAPIKQENLLFPVIRFNRQNNTQPITHIHSTLTEAF